MSLPDTNKKLLVKRHGASANINKKQKRSNVLPSIDVNQTNISFHETQSSSISSPNRNVSTRSKSAIQRSKTVTKTQFDVHKQIPPQVLPRTIFPPKRKVEELSPPIIESNKANESDFVEKQITKLTLVNAPEKLVLPTIKNANQIVANQTISATPYIPGLCGLNNIGNTCFMNSALQCLSNVPELTQWAQNYKQHSSNHHNKDIIAVYTSLIQSMWSGQNCSINPRDIKVIVSRSAPIFADYAQKDSHEFMNSLLNALERTNSVSIIKNLFHINTQSQVTCSGCHFVDTTDEITTFLPLSLPQKSPCEKEILLEDLINDYCLEDDLEGSYYCHKCQKYNQAKQKTNISLPLPRVLIIQLKRFPFDGTYRKIDTFVRYKLQYQNLISQNDIYQLCAVSSHAGSLAGGHYTALAKNVLDKQWYKFDDDSIGEIDSNSVVTSNAYVLIYLKSEGLDSSISE